MKVRLTTFARPDQDLLEKFSKRYLFGTKIWKDLEFVTDESYDRLVIFTYPYKETFEAGYKAEKAITFMTEPSISFYSKSHPTSRVLDFHLHLPFFPNYYNIENELNNKIDIKKTELLSIIVSELSALPGHQARLKFVHALDQIIENGLDIFGRPSNGNFFKILSNYKGFLLEKYNGLWSYYYHLACENCFEASYFTEKIIDPIITETLCFYDGCIDIEKYIDPKAYIKINIMDMEETVSIITKCIQDNEWAKRWPFIKQQKKRFLSELHPLNLIWLALHEKNINRSIIYGF